MSELRQTVRLSADDLGYHVKLLQAMGALEREQQELLAMQEELNARPLVWRSWYQHLIEKYELNPGDSITADGQLLRGAGEADGVG